MAYGFGSRIDDDSYAVTIVDEDQGTAVTKGEINGVPFESGGGGSSDFSTAEVTVDTTAAPEMINFTFYFPYLVDGVIDMTSGQNGGKTETYTAVLYQGSVVCFMTGYNLSVSGDAEIVEDGVSITGDCTITFLEM